MEANLLFEERQYLGLNKYSMIRRMAFAIFCFVSFYFADHDQFNQSRIGQITNIESNGNLFFLMGILILLWSTVLIFILHIKTRVYNGYVIIDGLWTSRKVKIDLDGILEVQVKPYSKYLLNRPVYNLHRKGRIRFYTRGTYAVELTDRSGLKYLIGSQQSLMLKEIIHNQLPNGD
ncbi:MAG: hypothetical protein RIE58_02540 [Vicingaceae bacterium]